MIASKEVLMAEFRVPRSRRWSPRQARAVLDEIERRGISVNRFAAERGLGAERLYRWKRRLGRRGRPSVAPPTRFAEVRVHSSSAGALIEIELPGGIAVRVGGESRVDDALALLSGLSVQ